MLWRVFVVARVLKSEDSLARCCGCCLSLTKDDELTRARVTPVMRNFTRLASRSHSLRCSFSPRFSCLCNFFRSRLPSCLAVFRALRSEQLFPAAGACALGASRCDAAHLPPSLTARRTSTSLALSASDKLSSALLLAGATTSISGL